MSDEITVIRVVIPDAKIVRINVSSLSSGGTSFVADVPLVLAGGHLSIPKSDSVTDGYLDNADWTTFNGKLSPVFFNPGGRLTTESGVPVSTSDRTSQGTLYYTPYKHNNIYTYSGSAWVAKTFAEISLSLTVTSGKNYDVFINSAATTLSLSAAWASDTSRTDALGTQDGVTVLSSDHTKLWLGTIRADGTNTTADSGGGSTTQVGGKRFVWNAYNLVYRHAAVIDTTDTWSYTTDTIRQANGASGNKVEYVTGDAASMIDAAVHGVAFLNTNSVRAAKVGVGIDSTTTFSGLVQGGYSQITPAGVYAPIFGRYVGMPGLGYHYISWNEKGADGTSTFLGDNGGDGQQTGLLVIGMT